MRRFFVLLLSVFAFVTLWAEDKIVMPEYPGGREALMKYVEENLIYPSTARKMEMSGEVVVEFTVDRGGQLTGINVIKGVSTELDQEALRVVRGMGRWNPGTKNGIPVRVTMTMPINFKLHKVNGFVDESKETVPGRKMSKRKAAKMKAARERKAQEQTLVASDTLKAN